MAISDGYDKLAAVRVLLALFLVAACGSPDTETNEACGPNGECPPGFECNPVNRRCLKAGSVTADAAVVVFDAPIPDAAIPDALVGCPPPTHGPTTHPFATLSASETWTADTSPHIVTGDQRVTADAVLTIEACAEVQLAANVALIFGQSAATSRLVAEGTADRPIRFHASTAMPWGKLQVFHPGSVSLAYATFDGGGSDRFQGFATIVAGGDRMPGVRPVLKVDHVTVTGSQGFGVRLFDEAGFAPGSTDLTVSGGGQNPVAQKNPVAMGFQTAGTLPSGSYDGDILLDGDVTVTQDTALHDRGAAYETGVNGNLRVQGATMTIEAGVTVKMRAQLAWVAGATPSTTGSIVAAGTADKKVTFKSLTADRWANLTAQHPGTISLTQTVLENGGDDRFRYDATLVAWGDGVLPVKPVLAVNNVVIRGSKGAGVDLDRMGAFTAESTALTVESSGGDVFGYPLHVTTPTVGTIPPGSYGGNLLSGILVESRGIETSDTFHDRGQPYVLPFSLSVVPRAAGTTASLTIEPGVTLRFGQNAYLTIGSGSTGSPANPGQLVATGTAEKPIVFTADSATPAPGWWRGINFSGIAPSGNKIENAVIEYAGADCSCVGFGCSPDEDAGVIFFNYRPAEAFIKNTIFRHIDGHGVTSGWRSDMDGPDFKPTNTFEDIKGCSQVHWIPLTGSCPSDPCY